MATSITVNTGTDELTWASAHGCSTGDMVSFTASVMPSPLVSGTSYYAIVSSSTVMQVATTRDNALVPTAINITTTGTTVVGTRDLGRVDEVNLSVQDGNPNVNLSNVPLAVTVVLTNIVTGSQLRVKDNSGVELYNATVSGTTATFTTKFAGTANVTVRYSSGGVVYQEYKSDFVIGSNGANVFISQVLDGTA